MTSPADELAFATKVGIIVWLVFGYLVWLVDQTSDPTKDSDESWDEPWSEPWGDVPTFPNGADMPSQEDTLPREQ